MVEGLVKSPHILLKQLEKVVCYKKKKNLLVKISAYGKSTSLLVATAAKRRSVSKMLSKNVTL